jgi:hypothetical protein
MSNIWCETKFEQHLTSQFQICMLYVSIIFLKIKFYMQVTIKLNGGIDVFIMRFLKGWIYFFVFMLKTIIKTIVKENLLYNLLCFHPLSYMSL